ncbi:MAG: histone deacetylase [Verrucomicrobia bacterium]|nr:histone deacetylase [Verrucomicrobiota bacterium]
MKIITDEHCTGYFSPGHPERPARITRTLEKLRTQTELKLTWDKPALVDEAAIQRAHSPQFIARLKQPQDFDTDTPFLPNIADYARLAVGGALEALKAARKGETVLSLLRPPGHHATRDRAMGFCYLNSVAISVLEALATGTKKAAVYDFDVHHGNGTEAILLDQPGAAFFSIHQHPCYPGTGTKKVGKNCFNYPVAPNTPREQYRKSLSQALEELKKFKPDLVAVSAGFDAYRNDPIAQETLEAEDYFWLGESIRKLGMPAFSVLEGGYSDELPELIFAYLKGLAG